MKIQIRDVLVIIFHYFLVIWMTIILAVIRLALSGRFHLWYNLNIVKDKICYQIFVKSNLYSFLFILYRGICLRITSSHK